MKLKNKRTLNNLTDFQSWNKGKKEGEQISLFDYATFIATPDILFAMAELFSPSLVEYDGCFFLEDKFDKNIYELWKKKGLSKNQIEKTMNHYHMSTILQSSDVSFDVAVACGHLIVEMWDKYFFDTNLKGLVLGDSFDELAVTLFHK